jgi:hypothetical protein
MARKGGGCRRGCHRAVLLLVMWREHTTGITLPLPTGHFAVGRATFTWINEAETDDLAPPPGAKRQVLVWLWYPATRSARDVPTEYPPAPWRAALEGRQNSHFLCWNLRAQLFMRHSERTGISAAAPNNLFSNRRPSVLPFRRERLRDQRQAGSRSRVP